MKTQQKNRTKQKRLNILKEANILQYYFFPAQTKRILRGVGPGPHVAKQALRTLQSRSAHKKFE